MSSIYRKGRDGYFYYQAYVYNTKTGKKDKRLFHSLGTKDQEIAKKKQLIFDARYERNKTSFSKNVNKGFNFFYLYFLIIGLIMLFVIYFNVPSSYIFLN